MWNWIRGKKPKCVQRNGNQYALLNIALCQERHVSVLLREITESVFQGNLEKVALSAQLLQLLEDSARSARFFSRRLYQRIWE